MAMFQRMKRFMLDNSYTHTDEWLMACMEWIESNFNNISEAACQKQVLDQWIDTNLEDLESSCLIANLAAQKCTRLTGKYGLQMNSIQDIGESSYNQWKQIKKLENENTNVTAASDTDNAWAPKPRRCLYLTLTDGRQVVYGLELVPISILSPNLKPGVKLLLTGPVECRRGVFQLRPSNVKIIGGEVESWRDSHSVEALIAQRLNIPRGSGGSQSQSNIATQPCTVAVAPAHRSTVVTVMDADDGGFPDDDGFPNDLDDDDDQIFMEIDENVLQGLEVGVSSIPPPPIQPPTIPRTSTNPVLDQGGGGSSVHPPYQLPTIPGSSSSSRNDNGKPKPKQLKIDGFMKPMPVIIKPPTPVRPIVVPTEQPGFAMDSFTMDESSESESRRKTPCSLIPSQTANTVTGIVLPIVSSTPIIYPIKVPGRPFLYIQQIKDNFEELAESGRNVRAKVCVTTITSNLQLENGAWTLSVSVNDGTGFLRCKLSSELINGIMGYDPVELKRLKSMKTPEAKQQINLGMKELTAKLVNLNAIVEIQLNPEPMIVNITDVYMHHVVAVKQRFSAL